MTVAPLPVLSLRQPYASLVAARRKWIETRAWRDRRRQVPFRMGIAASKRHFTGPWPEGLIAEVDQHLPGGLATYPDDLPLGELVATVQVTAFAPIGGPTSFRTGIVEGEEPEWGDVPVVVAHEASELGDAYLCIDWPGAKKSFGWGLGHDNITDQLPLGIFDCGRWAWLLADVQPLARRCPACWGSGTQAAPPTSWGGSGICPLGSDRQRLLLPCWVCGATGRRHDPLPAVGSLGLWTWTPPSGLSCPGPPAELVAVADQRGGKP